MSVYQCQNCGAAENTALGWYWNNTENKDPKYYKKNLCSACGPTHFENGESTGLGKWHGHFERVFYLKDSMITDGYGNLIPKDKNEKK